MKAITKTSVQLEGNKITITGELMDFTPHPIQSQRTTQLHQVSTNPSKPRQIYTASEGILVKRHGAEGVCFPRDEIVAIAIEIDSGLTDAPKQAGYMQYDLKPVFKTEIPATQAFFESTDDGKTWNEVATPSRAPGSQVKAVATNRCGKSESNIVTFPKAKSNG